MKSKTQEIDENEYANSETNVEAERNRGPLPEPARRLRNRILFHLRRAKKRTKDVEEAIYIADLEARIETDDEFFWRKWDAGQIPLIMLRVKRAARE